MSEAIQNSIIIIACLVSAAYIVRQAWRVLTGAQSGCGSKCNGCSGSSQNGKAFIALDELENSTQK